MWRASTGEAGETGETGETGERPTSGDPKAHGAGCDGRSRPRFVSRVRAPGVPVDQLAAGVVTRNSSFVPSAETATSTSSPFWNSASRIFSDSGSSMKRWIARLSGRAP